MEEILSAFWLTNRSWEIFGHDAIAPTKTGFAFSTNCGSRWLSDYVVVLQNASEIPGCGVRFPDGGKKRKHLCVGDFGAR